MINTKELRLGNIVNEEVLGDCIINGISDENVSVEVPHMTAEGILTNRTYFISNNSINPIPLTEEWLKNFGFERLTSKSDGFKSNSYSYTNGISFIVHLNDNLLSVNFWQGNEKKYVHQLENLYFSLTNEELTLQ